MKHPEPSLLWLSSLARPIDSLLVREMTWFDRTSLYTPHGVFTDSQLFLRSTFLRPTTAIVVPKTSWLPVYKFLEENSSFRSISTLYIYIYISSAKHVKRDTPDTRLIKCHSPLTTIFLSPNKLKRDIYYSLRDSEPTDHADKNTKFDPRFISVDVTVSERPTGIVERAPTVRKKFMA